MKVSVRIWSKPPLTFSAWQTDDDPRCNPHYLPFGDLIMTNVTKFLPSSTANELAPSANEPNTPPAPVRLMRLAEVMRLTGLRRTTLYNMQARSEFPLRVVISPNTVAWVEAEVQQWLAQRSSARSTMSARLPLKMIRPAQ
jgi:prophage regulatory protein